MSLNRYITTLPEELQSAVEQEAAGWHAERIGRLHARDASLWTDSDESDWLGWLGSPGDARREADAIVEFAAGLKEQGYSSVVLLGMGGSSMAPEVFALTFGEQAGWPVLHVLDSTDPVQVAATENAVDLEKTVFIVASKSGGTLEPNILKEYFFQRLVETVGAEQAPRHFVAITDPGSGLEAAAGEAGFLRTFLGNPEIGGRFSVLSVFGLVPAAITGIDIHRLLEETMAMVAACRSGDVEDNPGVELGVIIGAAARSGRDKLCVMSSPGLASFGAWLEQLIAESTGKSGKGILPLDGEPAADASTYGSDRFFVSVELEADGDSGLEERCRQLAEAGCPILRIRVADRYRLGQEFYRWEVATAVAGAVLGVNPFDQPDVEASKVESRRLLALHESGEVLPAQTMLGESQGLVLYSDEANAAAIRGLAGKQADIAGLLAAHLSRIEAGDYFALLAYLSRDPENHCGLQAVRQRVLERHAVATSLGFGPRFLHSTGQYYKGGPNTGVFLVVTADVASDLPVPGQQYTFGAVETGQAIGDFEVLAQRGRRLLRVHLACPVADGLERLARLLG